MPTPRKTHAKYLRRTRRLHRWSGVTLFVFFFVIGVTSVLLGWKKQSDYLQPSTHRGTELPLAEWLPADELLTIAQSTLTDSLGTVYSTDIDRMDYRPGKGTIKFLFRGHLQEVQLDGATGEVLSIGARRSDLIEQIHDGSIVSDAFKVVYSSVLGLATIVFTVSGFWLWYGPKVMRRSR